jgi:hypothetical protein
MHFPGGLLNCVRGEYGSSHQVQLSGGDHTIDPSGDICDGASTPSAESTESDSLPVPAEWNGSVGQSNLDPFEPRPYIEIRPSETAINPVTAIRAMHNLHARLDNLTKTGLVRRIRRKTQRPLAEWLIVSDGRPDPAIRYLVGTQYEDIIDDIFTVLRTCFPNTYEFDIVDWHPRMAEETLPIPHPGADHRVELSNGRVLDTNLDPFVSGVEFFAEVDRRRDWQTALARFDGSTPPDSVGSGFHHSVSAGRNEHREESHHIPLSDVIETMAEARVPIIYQVLTVPLGDWEAASDDYISDINYGRGTIGGALLNAVFMYGREDLEEYTPPHSDIRRIESIKARESHCSFQVSARAVALTRDDPQLADSVARKLASSLRGFGGEFHRIKATIKSDGKRGRLIHKRPGLTVYQDLIEQLIHPVSYESLRRRVPFKSQYSKGIVVDANELAGFCLVDGAGLTPSGQRSIDTRRRERTALSLPPPGQLARYVPPGMELCMPLTHDRRPYGRPLFLPEPLQNRHLIVVGDTGSGKSVLMQRALLSNVESTQGPEILLDYKGGGTSEEYLRTHYAKYGDLDNVIYFDLSRTLPALSFFDIEPLLEAGISREEARSRKAGHYEEILQGLMGAEKYGEAAESVKAIRNHLRALFDPVHGTETFAHSELYNSLLRTQRGAEMPAVSDDQLNSYFEGLSERHRDVFNKVLGGAISRVETIATDGRLAPLFNHTHHSEEAPTFEFVDHIDEDSVIIFDFAGIEGSVKRTLTLVILSNLWTALKTREQKSREQGALNELVQVNLYLEEARDIAATPLLDTLLAEGRSFGLSIAMGLQYVEQLKSIDPEKNTYQEALNETATFLVGNVSVDGDLPKVLATESMNPDQVARRLASMGRGEWLVRPASGFEDEPVRPFLAESLSPSPGHPAGVKPLAPDETLQFQRAFEDREDRVASESGIMHDQDELNGSTSGDDVGSVCEQTQSEPSEAAVSSKSETKESHSSDQNAEAASQRVDTLLTHTKRMPPYVYFDEDADAIRCDRCAEAYEADMDGMIDAIECCYSFDEVEPGDIPICKIDLKLSQEEISQSPWSVKQILFMKVLHDVRRLRYEPPAYDILFDSMNRLVEYVGITDQEVEELLEAGLVFKDADRPHRIYSMYAEGRNAIGESSRHGVDFGHGVGDLRESTLHIIGVILGVRLLVTEYLENPDSDVSTVEAYYEMREGILPDSAFPGDEEAGDDETSGYERRRLDVAGLNADGEVVVAVEVERVHSSSAREVPADFDKMAACEPDDAIWIVMNRQDGHDVLKMLYNPKDGEPRIDKYYQNNTPLQRVSIDSPGLTQIYSIVHLRDSRLELDEFDLYR